MSDPIAIMAGSDGKTRSISDPLGLSTPLVMNREMVSESSTAITGIEYPRQVLVGQEFTISVTVAYHVVSDTQFYVGVVLSGENDWQDSVQETISGDFAKTYPLSISAQYEPKLVASTVEVLRELQNQSWVLDDYETCLTRVLTSTTDRAIPVAIECLPALSRFPIGGSATVQGFVSPCIAECEINLYIVKPDQSKILKKLLTDASGSYSYNFVPDSLGEWSVYAVANGKESMRRHFTVESMPNSVLQDFPLEGQTWDYERTWLFQWESHGSCVVLGTMYFEILAVNKEQDYYDWKMTEIHTLFPSSIEVFFENVYVDGTKEKLTGDSVSGTWIRRAHMNGEMITWLPGSDSFNETRVVLKTEILGFPEWPFTISHIAELGERPWWTRDPEELIEYPTETKSTPAGTFDCWLNKTSGVNYDEAIDYIKDSGLSCSYESGWNDDWFGIYTVLESTVLNRITSSKGQVNVEMSADRSEIDHEKTRIWEEISTQATVTVKVKNQGAAAARDVTIDIKVPDNFETTDSISWKGDIPAQSEKQVRLSVNAKRCGQGIFAVDVTYKNEIDDVVKVQQKSTTISVADYIILGFGDGWTDVNLARQTVGECKGWGVEPVVAGVWASTMIHSLGGPNFLDLETIRTLLEHANDVLDWLNLLVDKGEISLDFLAALVDMIFGVALNSLTLGLSARSGRTGGRGHFYEDGTMDFRCMWPISALQALKKDVIKLIVDAILTEVVKTKTTNKDFLYLEDPQGQLYLRVLADGKELEVRYDQNRALAVIEPNVTQFSYSINATEAHENIEQYGIAYWTIRDGVLVNGEDFYNPIQKGTLHECEVRVSQSGELDKISDYEMFRYGEDFHLHAKTNSTISEFSFVRNQKKIFFKINGLNNAVGFCNITIPKSILDSTSVYSWRVLFNRANLTYSITANATHTSLYFTYKNSELARAEIIGDKTIGLIGDLNDDFRINVLDIATAAIAFGSTPENGNWNMEADLDNTELINIVDIAQVSRRYGEVYVEG